MFYYYYDGTYLLVVIGALLSLMASAKVKSSFARYSNVRSMSGMTGREAAERILRNSGIYDVQVQHIYGNLTDHYDPRNKVLSLSDSVYNSNSVAAIGVAAHECGHAIQQDVYKRQSPWQRWRCICPCCRNYPPCRRVYDKRIVV